MKTKRHYDMALITGMVSLVLWGILLLGSLYDFQQGNNLTSKVTYEKH